MRNRNIVGWVACRHVAKQRVGMSWCAPCRPTAAPCDGMPPNGFVASRRSRPALQRRGMAPLELVMALPILLFIMALMVNAGVQEAWKVRALCVARNGLWGNRMGRSLAGDPLPNYPLLNYWPSLTWPGQTALGNAPGVDDQRVDLPVARGPTLSAGTGSVIGVYSELLDPSRDLMQGNAQASQTYPLLAKVLHGFTVNAQDAMLDNSWQFWTPHPTIVPAPQIPGSNTGLRIPLIYQLPDSPQSSNASDQNLAQNYMTAVMALYNFMATNTALNSLNGIDNDDMSYRIQLAFSGLNYGAFVPSLQGIFVPGPCPCNQGLCTVDNSQVQPLVDDPTQGLIARIKGGPAPGPLGVAKTMTQAYLAMYQWAQQQIQNMGSAEPPPSPAQMAAMQSQLQQIQQDIDQLNQFLGTLP